MAFEFSDDFFRDEVDQRGIIEYQAATEIPYNQGPPLPVELYNKEEFYELPIIRCECGKNLGPDAGKFLAIMQQKQAEIWEETGQKMTANQFSEISMSTLTQILAPELGPTIPTPKPDSQTPKTKKESVSYRGFRRSCCMTNIFEPIIDKWGLNKCKRFIEGEKHPDKSSLVPGYGNTIYTSAPRTANKVIKRGLSLEPINIDDEWNTTGQEFDTTEWRAPAPASASPSGTNSMGLPTGMSVSKVTRVQKPGENQLDRALSKDISLANVTRVKKLGEDIVSPVKKPGDILAVMKGDLKVKIGYNAYNFDFNAAYDAMFSEPTEEDVEEDIIVDSLSSLSISERKPNIILPAPPSDLFYINENLFPSMPSTDISNMRINANKEGWWNTHETDMDIEEQHLNNDVVMFVPDLVVQRIVFSHAGNLFEKEPHKVVMHPNQLPTVTGILSTGIAGMAVPVISGSYLAK